LYLPNNDTCVKTGRVFCRWACFLEKTLSFFHKFLSIWLETEFELDYKTIISRKSPVFSNLFSPFSYKNAPKLFSNDKKWCLKDKTCLNASLRITQPSPNPILFLEGKNKAYDISWHYGLSLPFVASLLMSYVYFRVCSSVIILFHHHKSEKNPKLCHFLEKKVLAGTSYSANHLSCVKSCGNFL